MEGGTLAFGIDSIVIEDDDKYTREGMMMDDEAGPSVRATQLDLFDDKVGVEPLVLIEGRTLKGEVIQFKARQSAPVSANVKKDRLATPFYQLLCKVEEERCQPRKINYSIAKDCGELWVDKYRPRRFIDLVASDRGHVEVLQWVTQWRHHIERGDPPPEHKILLLAGPPGLGKTTVAHVTAETAGFEVVEINASDERIADQVTGKIEAAIRSDSMLPGRRPNLLIIDEIDGAIASTSDRGLISHLVKIVGEGTPQVAEPIKKKKRRIESLKRPIICICNDVFTSALRPLRGVAQIVAMKRPNAAVLSGRLGEISSAEGLKAEGKALLELADLMDCDMRASLHALQFIASNHNGGPLTTAKLSKMLTGLKDATKSTMAVYESIFYADPRKKSHLDDVLGIVNGHGECERLMMGVFELYPQCKFYDDTRLSKINAALEWLSFVDRCQGCSLDERFASYQAYALVKIHGLFASPMRPQFKFPRADYEYHQKQQANQQILESYLKGLSVNTRLDTTLLEALSRLIPVITLLIRPNLRIVHTH